MPTCEHMHPVTENSYLYIFPDDTEAGYLCDECAVKDGFCPVCGYFVLGSGDDWSLNSIGCCAECYDELRSDLGEYDDPDEIWC